MCTHRGGTQIKMMEFSQSEHTHDTAPEEDSQQDRQSTRPRAPQGEGSPDLSPAVSVHLRPASVPSGVWGSFALTATALCPHCSGIPQHLLIRPAADGHLGCAWSHAGTNKAGVSILSQVSVSM